MNGSKLEGRDPSIIWTILSSETTSFDTVKLIQLTFFRNSLMGVTPSILTESLLTRSCFLQSSRIRTDLEVTSKLIRGRVTRQFRGCDWRECHRLQPFPVSSPAEWFLQMWLLLGLYSSFRVCDVSIFCYELEQVLLDGCQRTPYIYTTVVE